MSKMRLVVLFSLGLPAAAILNLSSIKPIRPSVTKIFYGETEGRKIYQYTLTNNKGMMVKVINYGGTITDILTPDRNGKLGNVVLGFDSLQNYVSKQNARMGAIRGRVTNRVAGSRFSIHGNEYKVVLSKNGEAWGINKRIWDISEISGKDSVALKVSYLSPDGEDGYPGNLKIVVTYTLTNNNSLKIHYSATTDKATPLVITSHSYFNLSGGLNPDILNTQMMINALQYLEVDNSGYPTGNFSDVHSTPFDFTTPHTIGERINDNNDMLINSKGYDVTYSLSNNGKLVLAGITYEPLSGRTMKIFTTEPGMIFYTGNSIDSKVKGKGGIPFVRQGAFCAETQHYPNSVNQPNFPNTVLQPSEVFNSTTVYQFGVRK